MGAIQRILEYLDYKGISKYKFYKKTGLSNGFLDKGENIGSDKCEIIIYQYPDMNIEWLIMGKGPMIKKEYPSSSYPNEVAEDMQPYKLSKDNKQEVNILRELITSHQQTIHALKETVESQKTTIDSLKNQSSNQT